LATDALSRSFFSAWSSPKHEWLDILKADIAKDEGLSKNFIECSIGGNDANHYTCRNGILLWKERVVIPPNSSLIQLILQEYHDGPLGGHSGVAKTIDRIAFQFYWPNMKNQIREYVLHCMVCRQAKTETKSPAGLLHSLPIPSQVLEDISMDFIASLPPTHGYLVVMVIVDRLSKFAHFVALKHDFDSRKVAEAFV